MKHKIIVLPLSKKDVLQFILIGDDEPKDGDWYINTFSNYVGEQKGIIDISENRKKIIASNIKLGNLPIFTKDFLEEWTLNPVDEIEVGCEMFDCYEKDGYNHKCENCFFNKWCVDVETCDSAYSSACKDCEKKGFLPDVTIDPSSLELLRKDKLPTKEEIDERGKRFEKFKGTSLFPLSIEDAAREYSCIIHLEDDVETAPYSNDEIFNNTIDDFIEGAKSDAAKNYWFEQFKKEK